MASVRSSRLLSRFSSPRMTPCRTALAEHARRVRSSTLEEGVGGLHPDAAAAPDPSSAARTVRALGGFAAGCGGDSPSAVSVTVTVTTQASTDATETSAESATDTRASDETAPPEETFTDDGTDTRRQRLLRQGRRARSSSTRPSAATSTTSRSQWEAGPGQPARRPRQNQPLLRDRHCDREGRERQRQSRDAPLADGGNAPLYVTLYERVPAAAGVDDDIVPQLGCDPSAEQCYALLRYQFDMPASTISGRRRGGVPGHQVRHQHQRPDPGVLRHDLGGERAVVATAAQQAATLRDRGA